MDRYPPVSLTVDSWLFTRRAKAALSLAAILLCLALLTRLDGASNVPGLVPVERGEAKPVAALAGEAVPAVNPGWWQTIEADLRRSEYSVTWQEGTPLPGVAFAYQAPNRAHNLRTYFTQAGIHVLPRTEQEATWEWGLALTGYGYGNRLQPVAAAELTVSGNRVVYERAGLTEWYENGEAGLEQGFTLDAPPLPRQQPGDDELVLELALSGNLTPLQDDEGQAVVFAAPGGMQALRYSELAAYDAQELALPASMRLAGCAAGSARCLQLVVDDSQATYPITIDPLATSPDWTAEGDQAGALFGYAVGTAGDVNGDGYDDVIVGAYGYDNGQNNEGRAFVYHGSSSGLGTTAAWTAESDQASANFGIAVGTAGDVNGDGYDDVIVGASGYDNGQMDEGMAFVYHGSSSGLGTTAAWTAEGNLALAYFGVAVGTAGDVNGDGYDDVIVGASNYYNNFDLFEGWAFVYHGSATGLSTTANWTAEGNQMYANFGSAVATAGDVNGDGYDDVIVGAAGANNARVYLGSPTGLNSSASWSAAGSAVATAGDANGDGYADVVVGRYSANRADVYHGSPTGLSATADWTGQGDAGSYYGVSVGTAGDVNGDGYDDVIIGAYGYDNGETDEGAAFVYHGSPAGLSATAAWSAESDQASAYYGISVGTAGDVNGDGYDDIIVGASFYDNGEADEGRAYVYYGAGDGASPLAADFSATPTSGTAPLAVSFTDTSTPAGAADVWSWDFGDGGSSTVQHPVYTYTVPGTYSVTLTVTDTESSQSDMLVRANHITVHEAAALAAVFTAAPTSGTAPLAVTFTDTSTPAGAADVWLWDFGDGGTSSVQHPMHTYTAVGAFTVTLTVTDTATSQTDTLLQSGYITVTATTFDETWEAITTASAPPVNGEYAMAYDRGRDVVVLYGGNGAGWPYENGTWEFDGSDWAQVTTAQQPGAVYGMAMAYDAGRGVAVLFGGSDSTDQELGETWEYDGTDWTQATPTTSPPARTGAVLVYDAGNQLITLFAGNDKATTYGDLWQYDGASWNQVSTGAGPPARTLAAMAYHAGNGRLYLFGGRDGSGDELADLWTFDPATSSWSDIAASGPQGRYAHSLTYDASSASLVLSDGAAAAGDILRGDTWHYQLGAGWTEGTGSGGTPAAAYHSAVYDETEWAVILFQDGATWAYR